MTTFIVNTIGLIAGVIGIVVGTWGVYVAIKTKQEQWKIAEKSGAFRKPDLELLIYDWPLGDPTRDNENWLFIHPGEDNDIGVFPIRFTILNTGDAASEELVLRIQVPKACFRESMLDGLELDIKPGLFHDDMKWSVDETGQFTLLSFALPPIKPKSMSGIEIPFVFYPTMRKELIDAESKDHVHLELSFEFLVTLRFALALYPLNSDPLYYKASIGAIAAQNLDSGIRKYIELKSKGKSTTRQTKRTFLDRLRARFAKSPRPQLINFLAFDVESRGRFNNQVFYLMKIPRKWGDGSRVIWNISRSKEFKPGQIVSLIDFYSVQEDSLRK